MKEMLDEIKTVFRQTPVSDLVKIAGHGLLKLLHDAVHLLVPHRIFVHALLHREGNRFRHDNWGDDINVSFIESISDLKVLHVDTSRLYALLPVKSYQCIGSMLGRYGNKKIEVWGSGFIDDEVELSTPPERIHLVRGPLTRRRLMEQGYDCPEKYGDPVLLVSRYYQPTVQKKYALGIIPHYIDSHNPVLEGYCRQHSDTLLISMQGYGDWREIPDKICSCERIVSSSLHGLIVSDSYGVPNAWIQLSNDILGGDFKYLDYFASVKRFDVEHALKVSSCKDIEKIVAEDAFGVAADIDYNVIYESCPFKNHLENFLKHKFL